MVDLTDASKQAIHLAILQLLEKKQIVKFGKAPKTIYRIAGKETVEKPKFSVEDTDKLNYLDENFLLITEI